MLLYANVVSVCSLSFLEAMQFFFSQTNDCSKALAWIVQYLFIVGCNSYTVYYLGYYTGANYSNCLRLLSLFTVF